MMNKKQDLSEERMHSLKQMASSASLIFFFGILGYIIMFFFRLLAARHFGPEGYGIYTLLETIKGILFILALCGTAEGIARFVPYYLEKKEYAQLRGYLSFVFKFPFILSVILTILTILFSDQITSFFGFPSSFSLYLQLTSFVFPLRVLSRVFRRICYAKKETFYATFSYDFLEKFILLAMMIIIFIFNLSLFWLVIGLIASMVLPFLFDLLVYLKKIHLPKADHKVFLIKEWLVFSFPLFFVGLFSYVMGWSDNLVIAKYLPAEQLGIYAAAFSLGSLLDFFQRAFSPIFTPLITEQYVKGNHAEISFLFRKSAAWIFGLTFPIFLVMFFYAPFVLHFIFGEGYIPGASVLMIIALGFLINIATGLNYNILLLHQKTKVMFILNVIIVISNVLMNIALIPYFGIVGPALASGGALALKEVISFFIAKRYEKISLDYRYNLKFILAGLPSILIALFIFYQIPHFYTGIIVSALIYVPLYILFLLLLRTFKEEDYKILLVIEKRTGISFSFLKRFISH